MDLPPPPNSDLLVWGEPTSVRMFSLTRPFAHASATPAKMSFHVGGSALATALGVLDADERAERAPLPLTLISPRATDAEGCEIEGVIQDAFRASHSQFIPLDTSRSRSTAVIVEPDGTRSIVSDPGDAFAQPWSQTLDPDQLPAAGIFHIALTSIVGDVSGALENFVATLTRRGFLLSLDLGSEGVVRAARPLLGRLFAASPPTLVFGNEEEVRTLDPRLLDPTASLSVNLPPTTTLVLKRGPRETLLRCGRHVISVPVAPTSVVDTTGAGDALAAGFLAGYRRGCVDLAELTLAGHSLAAAVIARTGTTLHQ